MLSTPNRLRRRAEISSTVRSGRRAGGAVLSVHLLVPEHAGQAGPPPRAAFVVGRTVGPSVLRSLVQRRLRHLVRERVQRLPDGSRLVVRARPAAARASFRTLGTELDRALDRILNGELSREPERAPRLSLDHTFASPPQGPQS